MSKMKFDFTSKACGRVLYVLLDIIKRCNVYDTSNHYLPIYKLNRRFHKLIGELGTVDNILFGLPRPFNKEKEHRIASVIGIIELNTVNIRDILQRINDNRRFWLSNISYRLSVPKSYPIKLVNEINNYNGTIKKQILHIIRKYFSNSKYKAYAINIGKRYKPNVKQFFLF